jgi:hypothetical protein
MSDTKDGGSGSTLGASPLQIIVKGGTTSGAYDKERAKQRHAAEAGRAHQDKQHAAAAVGNRMTERGFVSAHIDSLNLLDSGSPRVVFYYLRRDKSVMQECVGEIVVLPDGDELFTLVCPKCLERGESHGSAQVMVKKSHRKWELDTKKAGEIVFLTDPFGRPFQVRICGTIECDEPLRCSNVGCAWAVKIDKGNVREI